MEDKENLKVKNEIVSIWFGFPLNKSNSVVLLMLSFLGVMSLPALIFEYVFYLFYYNSIRDYYGLIHIIFYSTCFILSLYTFLKVIKGVDILEMEKKAVLLRTDRVLWFGIHLTYNQVLFLFALSLSGILFTSYYSIMVIFDYTYSYYGFMYTYLGNPFTHIALLIICIFTVYRIKNPQIVSDDAKDLNTISLFVVILSIILFISLLFPTLAYAAILIFNIISIIFNGYNHYGGLIYPITLGICISLLVLSVLNLKRKFNFSITLKKSSKISQKPKLLGIIKINSITALLLLSLSIFVTIYLLFDLSFKIFIVGSVGMDIFTEIIYGILLLILCVYTIDFILKKNRLELFLESFYSEKFPKNKWLGLNVNKYQSTIIFWLSLFSGSYLIILIIYFFIKLPIYLYFVDLYPELFGSLINTSVGIIVKCFMAILYSYSTIVTRKFRNF